MGNNSIDYQALVQEALRGVVRAVLQQVEKEGRLPGAHHFYIAFHTKHPGVKVSEAIHQRYPQEMTIVLQHQFWDLHVGDEDFQITLSFNNVSEKLSIPYAAVKNFFDPSTRFGLQFTVAGMEPAPARVLETPGRPTPPAAAPEAINESVEAAKTEDAPRKPGEVVSLDQFRKK